MDDTYLTSCIHYFVHMYIMYTSMKKWLMAAWKGDEVDVDISNDVESPGLKKFKRHRVVEEGIVCLR